MKREQPNEISVPSYLECKDDTTAEYLEFDHQSFMVSSIFRDNTDGDLSLDRAVQSQPISASTPDITYVVDSKVEFEDDNIAVVNGVRYKKISLDESTEKDNIVEYVINDKRIAAADTLQNTIASYSSIKYFAKNFGIELPEINTPLLVTGHTMATVWKVASIDSQRGGDGNIKLKLIFMNSLTTIKYLASIAASQIFKVLPLSNVEAGSICAAHGVAQFSINQGIDTVHKAVLGDLAPSFQSFATSTLYGTAFVAADCGRQDEVSDQFSTKAKYISLGSSIFAGAAVLYYQLAKSYKAEDHKITKGGISGILDNTIYFLANSLNFETLNSFFNAGLKAITTASVTAKITNVVLNQFPEVSATLVDNSKEKLTNVVKQKTTEVRSEDKPSIVIPMKALLEVKEKETPEVDQKAPKAEEKTAEVEEKTAEATKEEVAEIPTTLDNNNDQTFNIDHEASHEEVMVNLGGEQLAESNA